MGIFADRTCVVIHFLWDEQPYMDFALQGHGHLMFWTKADQLTRLGIVHGMERDEYKRNKVRVLEPFAKWAGEQVYVCEGMTCRADMTVHARRIMAGMLDRMHGSGLLTPDEIDRPMHVHLRIDEPHCEPLHWMWAHGPDGVTLPEPPEKALLRKRVGKGGAVDDAF